MLDRTRFTPSARRLALSLTLSITILGSGCSKEPGTSSPAPSASTTPARPGVLGKAGITGRVIFEGTLPAPEKVKMTGDPYCSSHGTGEAVKEEVLVGPDKGLANVFVYVKDGVEGSYPAPSEPVVLDQKGCTYHPRVFGIIVGQTLEILNNDETTHNVRAKCVSNPSFNLGMPGKDARVARRFENPEVMVSIKCDVHGWMQSFAGVVSHPFFSVTGESGNFSIKNLPQGTYTIEAVHEKFGRLTQKVTITGDEALSATFTFRPVA